MRSRNGEDAIPNRVPDCERFDREHGYCIEGPDCTCEPDIGPEDVAGHATRNRVEIAAEFLWEAYKRGNYPGMPKWADVNEIQKDACRFDARGLLEKVDAT